MTRTDDDALESTRRQILEQVEDWLETPMLVLSVIWLGLVVVEFVWGLTPFLETLGFFIWGLFVVDFLLRFSLAPRKMGFLASSWLTIASLLLPALRVFRLARLVRVLRTAQAARGVRLLKVMGSLNRGLAVMRTGMRRRGLGYVLALSLLVLVLGAAGMHGLERGGTPGFSGYGESIWWTARILMTIGPETWPRTPEGRVLALLLALYGYAVFGYVTASIATILLGQDAARQDTDLAGKGTLKEIQAELRAVHRELRARREGV